VLAQQSEERLLYRRPDLAASLDIHGWANRDELGFDGRLLRAG